MQTEYAAQYRNLWQNHWWWMARKKFVHRLIRRVYSENSTKEILDIGCGDGLFFPELEEFGRPWGVEPDANLLSSSNPYVDRIKVEGFGPDYAAPVQFDLMVMMDVIEHIADDAAALEHAYSLLAPKGAVIITVPALQALWSQHDVVNQHFRRYSPSSLRGVLENSGFKIKEFGFYFGWAAFPMMIRRWLQPAQSSNTDDVYQVTIPHPIINKSMYLMSRIEQGVQRVLPLPVGSSLFAVAEKY